MTWLDVRQESTRHSEVMDTITKYLGLGSYMEWNEVSGGPRGYVQPRGHRAFWASTWGGLWPSQMHRLMCNSTARAVAVTWEAKMLGVLQRGVTFDRFCYHPWPKAVLKRAGL
eukprot:scaffold84016_cov21-Tisochrysis_lutea.AAC.4